MPSKQEVAPQPDLSSFPSGQAELLIVIPQQVSPVEPTEKKKAKKAPRIKEESQTLRLVKELEREAAKLPPVNTEIDESNWPTAAKCRKISNPDILFVNGPAQKVAALFCRGCLVQDFCLAEAIAGNIEHGVWGGKAAGQRKDFLAYEVNPDQKADMIADLRARNYSAINGSNLE